MNVIRCLKCGKQLTNMDISNDVMLSYFWCSNCNIDYYIRAIVENKNECYADIRVLWSK